MILGHAYLSTMGTQAPADTSHDVEVARAEALKTIATTLAAAVQATPAVVPVVESDSSSSDEAAAAAPQQKESTDNEVTVQFRQAYRARNNSTGALSRRSFAFGSNPGNGPAPAHMRRMTTSVTALYVHTGTGNQSFIAQDPLVPVVNGMQCPQTLVALTRRPRTGTVVYMFFPQEAGVTFT